MSSPPPLRSLLFTLLPGDNCLASALPPTPSSWGWHLPVCSQVLIPSFHFLPLSMLLPQTGITIMTHPSASPRTPCRYGESPQKGVWSELREDPSLKNISSLSSSSHHRRWGNFTPFQPALGKRGCMTIFEESVHRRLFSPQFFSSGFSDDQIFPHFKISSFAFFFFFSW